MRTNSFGRNSGRGLGQWMSQWGDHWVTTYGPISISASSVAVADTGEVYVGESHTSQTDIGFGIMQADGTYTDGVTRYSTTGILTSGIGYYGGHVYVAGLRQNQTVSNNLAVLKLSTSGSVVASYNVVSPAASKIISIQDMKMDASGNVYMCGQYAKTALVSVAWVAKLDSDLNLTWTKSFSLPNTDPGRSTHKANDQGAYGVTFDSSGNVYITGSFAYAYAGTSTFAGYTQTVLYVAKFSSGGTLQWLKGVNSSTPRPGYTPDRYPDSNGLKIANYDSHLFVTGNLGNYSKPLFIDLATDGSAINWQKTSTSSGMTRGPVLADSSGVYLTTYDSSAGVEYSRFLRTDHSGNLDWWKTFSPVAQYGFAKSGNKLLLAGGGSVASIPADGSFADQYVDNAYVSVGYSTFAGSLSTGEMDVLSDVSSYYTAESDITLSSLSISSSTAITPTGSTGYFS